MSASDPSRLNRRAALKWMLAVAATAAALDRLAPGAERAKSAKGYGTDPNLLKDYQPGDLWPLTFTDAQRRTAAALCDVIIPADARGPDASSLGVHDFIDEWISAPYPRHEADHAAIIGGLAWIDAESQRRFGRDFANLAPPQQHALCDDICHEPDAKSGFKAPAGFFRKFRDLTAAGYYSTREGMQDIGYVGNVPLASFDGPPPDVLRKLGL